MWCYKNVPNVYMAPPTQVTPINIEPIEYSNIKPKTFSTSGIRGEFLFQQETPRTPMN